MNQPLNGTWVPGNNNSTQFNCWVWRKIKNQLVTEVF